MRRWGEANRWRFIRKARSPHRWECGRFNWAHSRLRWIRRRPICPVAVRGARQILRDGNYLPRPGRMTVTFGPLVEPNPEAGDDWREIVRLRDATRKIIADNTGEPMI